MVQQRAQDAADLIDLDRAETWPSAVRQATEQRAAQIQAKGGDLGFTDTFDGAVETYFRALLHGHRVLTYHCTRLLDHEVTAIRADGLLPLSKALVAHRIDEVHARGLISDAERDLLRGATYLTSRQPMPSRGGNVFLFAGRSTLDDQLAGVWYLLTEWGGEAIRMTAESRALPDHLVTLGKPSVVVAALDFTASTLDRACGPPLNVAFAKTLLGEDRHGFSVTSRIAISPDEVLAIWQPGSAEYDQHVELPTA